MELMISEGIVDHIKNKYKNTNRKILKNTNQIMKAQININSIRRKLNELVRVISDNIDILMKLEANLTVDDPH